ncbi:MAG: hypothetical protein HYZ94_03395 [Candidatus Omnitrophica bacterium]|nr:hypothetical protein [Candidatus Omnitrophota bacterium]
MPSPDFGLEETLRSGQVFRWRQSGGGWAGWIGPRPAWVRQQDSALSFTGASPETLRRFFALDVDLPALTRRIDVDPFIHEALGRYAGLRVIRQEPWECLASFILSAFNNITRLTGMLNRLAAEYGELDAARDGAGGSPDACRPLRGRLRSASSLALAADTARRRSMAARSSDAGLTPAPAPGPYSTVPYPRPSSVTGSRRAAPGMARAAVVHCFPRPERLATVSERALRSCGLGYRAPYLRAAAQAVASGRAALERWAELEDSALREKLLEIPGVGEKVAECVMLFGYGRGAAFPVDVWIGRTMRERYFHGRKTPDRKIRAFAFKHFGPECGWAQQYLFCRARSKIGTGYTVPGTGVRLGLALSGRCRPR